MTPNELFNEIESSFTDASYVLLYHFFGREAQTQLTDMHINLGDEYFGVK
jgi:hypothetical protein